MKKSSSPESNSESTSSTDGPAGLPADVIHLAVDLGASGGRVIAGGLDDGRMSMVTLHRFANEPVRVHQSMFWNHLGLWHEILSGLRAAATAAETSGATIASVGVDTWGVDYALVDGNGDLCGSVRHYRDGRNVGMVDEAAKTMPRSQIFAQTGLQFMDINTLYQLIAARRAGDSALASAESFLMMGDLFHWFLSGRRTIEATNASTTQMLNPVTGQWSTDILRAFDLPAQWFAPPIAAGSVIGPVQPIVCELTGLGGSTHADVQVVAPATHDTASAVLAVPADEFAPAKPDWCYISSGTWSLMGVELPTPNLSPLCEELNFTNEGGVHGSTRLLKNIGGLWIFQQIRAALVKRGEAPNWDDMVAAAEAADPFGLLINPDDASLVAPVDMIDAIHRYAESTGQATPTDHAILFRASLEGLALRYRDCLAKLERLVGNPISTIHIVGGGSLNALLCQMTADACGRRVVAGPVEATAIGNLVMQMIGCGRIADINQARGIVRASFPVTIHEPRHADAWHEPARRFSQL